MSFEVIRPEWPIEQFEGNVPHLYKDTKGIITAGIGFALRSLREAQALSWDLPGQVRLDWAAVERAPKGELPSFYRQITRARLLNAELELRRRASGLLPTWALSLPVPAMAVLQDIRYNTGNDLDKQWPKLVAAIKAGDWKTAAAESNRPDVGKARNKWAANQLLRCRSGL